MTLPTTRMPVITDSEPTEAKEVEASEVSSEGTDVETDAAPEAETSDLFTPSASTDETLELFTTPEDFNAAVFARLEQDALDAREAARKQIEDDDAVFAALIGSDDEAAKEAVLELERIEREQNAQGFDNYIVSIGGLTRAEAEKQAAAAAKAAAQRSRWTMTFIGLLALSLTSFAVHILMGVSS